MMFPFALTLFNAAVQDKLAKAGSELPAAIRTRYGYEFGYKTVLSVLRTAERLSLPKHVAQAGALFAQLLNQGLAECKAVREVRVHGLLIGIEIDASRWPQRWFRKRLYSLYLYAMLHHARYPVLVGFCQYEPNVLKITPALTIAPEQIRDVCTTIVEVLRRPFHRLLATPLGGLLAKKKPIRRRTEKRPRLAISSCLTPLFDLLFGAAIVSTTTNTLTAQPMTIFHVDFQDLYARHLCRHSQFGINVVHIISLFGVWFGIYGLVYWLTGLWWLPPALAAGYLGLVALNAPARVVVATALFLALFVAAVLWLPELPIWVYLLMIPVLYKIQSWSHKLWTASSDMTEFNKRFPKGRVLFVVLLINEVPICLNYLLFDWKKQEDGR